MNRHRMKTPLIRLAKRDGMAQPDGVGHPRGAPSCWHCCVGGTGHRRLRL